MHYWLDERDRIVKVDEGWSAFASANGASALTPESVMGRPLSDFISDPTTLHLWQNILRNARRGAFRPVRIRCDAPDRRRVLTITLALEGGLVRVTSTVETETPRPSFPACTTDSAAGFGELHLTSCSWCNRFLSPSGAWVEAETLAHETEIFVRDEVPLVSHGICPECRAEMDAQLDALERSPSRRA